MAHTKVSSVILHRGWRDDPNCVYIGLAGYAGQTSGHYGKPWACLKDPRGWQEGYRTYLKQRLRDDPDFIADLADLHGKTLICFCKGKKGIIDKPCHGDILAKAVEFIYHGING